MECHIFYTTCSFSPFEPLHAHVPQLTAAMQCSRKVISFFFSFLKKGGGREKQQGPQLFSRFNFHITHVSTCVRGLEGSHGMGMSQASDKNTSVVTCSAFYSGD